jgi:predicted transcriptional regulator
MKKSYPKTSYTERTDTIDKDTGEILDSTIKTHKYLANTKEEFFLMYSSVLSIFHNMEQSEIRVYGYLLNYADGREFSIDKKLRIKMGTIIGLNERTIYNTLPVLEKKNLIFKVDGLYMINPRYAFKGSTMDRNNQLLRATIELGCKDC